MDKYKISADEFEKVSFANLPTHPNKYGERGMSAAELKERFDAQGRLFRAKLNNLVQLIQGDARKGESLADYMETGIEEGKSLKQMIEDIVSEGGAFAAYLSVGDTTLLKKLMELDREIKDIQQVQGAALDELLADKVHEATESFDARAEAADRLLAEIQALRAELEAAVTGGAW